MLTPENKHRILILGASGFLGNALYKELCSYFKTFGTYCKPNAVLEKNKHFFQYNVEEDDVFEILKIVKPSIVISALRGDFHAQTIAHQHVTEYIKLHTCKIIFLSSANVFDGYSKFPSYEDDKTLSESIYGHFKIKIENMLLRLPKQQSMIVRLPMVFGSQSPRVKELKQHIVDQTAVEIFPNLILNVTTDYKVTQQIHYMINRNKSGVFHLGSTDLVHHDEFIQDLTARLTTKTVHFKRVYTTNEDRYLAVMPKFNKLPKHLQITSHEVLEELEV
ncbi:MAG: sugar nucleotide-binding protein [Gelidibacter sp.]